jgi:hypothetical protein
MTTQHRRPVGQHPASFRLIMSALAILLAVAGQLFLGRQQAARGLALAVPAFLFFAGAHWRWPGVELPQRRPQAASAEAPLAGAWTWRLLFAVSSLMLALLAYGGFAGNNMAGGFWYWLGAMLYFLLAFAHRPQFAWPRLPARFSLVLLGITLLGLFFRFYDLDAVPAEMTSDHAEKLLDVHDVLMGWRPIFFPRNTGREALQFYLTAALIRLTPLSESHLALKIGTALVGAVTVPLTYFLARELYGRLAGLLAAFFIAVSHWHVAISRVGLRFPFTAAFTAPALAFLLRAFRQNGRNDWLAAGLILGLGLHSYTAMRVVPLLFLLLVLVKVAADLLQRWRGGAGSERTSLSRAFWENALLGGLLTLLAFLPLLRYLREDPDGFWLRASSRLPEGLPLSALWPTFWTNVKNALLMFNFRGDLVPTNTIPESPQLGLVSGGLFLLGLFYVIWRLVAGHERRSAYVLVSFFVLLLPSILSLAFPEENPSAVRTGGAIPVVMFITALPLALLVTALVRHAAGPVRCVGALFLAGTLVLAVANNAIWYFRDYDAQYRLSHWNATEIGAVAREFAGQFGSLRDVYHVPYPHWVDTRNIGINAGDVTWNNAVGDLDDIAVHALEPGPRLYLVHPEHDEAIRVLRAAYPQGELQFYDSPRPGKDFLLFRVLPPP